MRTFIGVSGSLRKASYNSGLLRAAAAAMPEGCELAIMSIAGIPLYDGDAEEAQGVPPAVSALKDAIARSAGLLIATPEYNNSIPGVLKNAVDWLTRPPDDIKRVWGGKPVAVMGASPGGFGTVLSQAAWLPVLRTLGTRPWFGSKLLVSRAGESFDENGTLADAKTRAQLERFLRGWVESLS